MRILFDINHPAHVHLFRHFIAYLDAAGHDVAILARRKDVTTHLLDHYGLRYIAPTRPGRTRPQMLAELLTRDWYAWRLHGTRPFTFAFGTSATIAHLSLVSGVRSYNLCEDDDDVVPLYAKLTYPFTTAIINASTVRYKRWARKRVFHNSYHKLAYLHPDVFTPDPAVPARYGLKPWQYVVLRRSALAAHHDFGARGISGRLLQRVRSQLHGHAVVETVENSQSRTVAPWDLHHVLAFAKLLVSDSQSMTVEAAVLGTPSLRYSSFVGRISCLEELEERYQLTRGFRPGQEEQLLAALRELLAARELEETWRKRRQAMLADKCNLTQWLIDFFEGLCSRRHR